MRILLLIIISLITLNSFSQELSSSDEEFIPITIEEKEAFMSTKTGEFIFRSHEKTDPTALKTTNHGVIYTDVQTHKVKKGESLHIIAKKYGLSVKELKTQNKISKANLSIGQKLKVVKKLSVKSSSPVLGTSGKETIVARLRPGQTPASLNAPSVNITKENKIKKAMSSSVPASNSDAEKVIKKEETNAQVVTKTNEKEDSSSYTVKAGDTLYSISKQFAISIKDLKQINGLVLNKINKGQKLKINQK